LSEENENNSFICHTYHEAKQRANEKCLKRITNSDRICLDQADEKESLIAETAYRRGYTQGWFFCVEAALSGITLKTLREFHDLKLYAWRRKKHNGSWASPPNLIKKDNGIPNYTSTTLEKISETLRLAAWGYGTAMFQHFDIDSKDFDKEAFEYIFSQCDFVKCHSKNVAVELFNLGVNQVELKHLQYFFSVEPPVFSPYMHLWKWCFDQMAEFGLLPPNAAKTLDRLINNKERRRPFTKS
jgi:hypothetical protein